MNRILLAACCFGAIVGPMGTEVAWADSPAVSIARQIVAQGQRRVAVLPDIFVASSAAELEQPLDRVHGELGARGPALAQQLYDELVAVSQRPEFRDKLEVIPRETVTSTLRSKGYTPTGRLDAQQTFEHLREAARADLLLQGAQVAPLPAETNSPAPADAAQSVAGPIAARGVTQSDKIHIVNHDLRDGHRQVAETVIDVTTLAKLAYAGKSWELRRWQGNGLASPGFAIADERVFALGANWEHWQAAHLLPALPHPLDIEDFPYGLQVQVNDQPRMPLAVQGVHGTQYVVELNPGETYALRLANRSHMPVYVAVFVDGVSVIDSKLTEPSNLELMRHWYLPAHCGWKSIRGWYRIPRDPNGHPLRAFQQHDRFRVAPKEQSVAAYAGGGSELGMITAVYYSVGLAGVTHPATSGLLLGKDLPGATLGTGRGDRRESQLEFVDAQPRGIILAAQTLYYRSREQIQAIQRGQPGRDPAFQHAPVVPVASSEVADEIR